MKALIAWVEQVRSNTESYFVKALMSEDIERLSMLNVHLISATSIGVFRKEAVYAGWSKDDMRTHELLPKLDPLIEVMWRHRLGTVSDQALIKAWNEFHDLRVERLVGCLTRTPQLDD